MMNANTQATLLLLFLISIGQQQHYADATTRSEADSSHRQSSQQLLLRRKLGPPACNDGTCRSKCSDCLGVDHFESDGVTPCCGASATPDPTPDPTPGPTDNPTSPPTTNAPTTKCGNGLCDSGEDITSCPADCFCGNGVCDVARGESHATCPSDCKCGDGTCDDTIGESCESCIADCGTCPLCPLGSTDCVCFNGGAPCSNDGNCPDSTVTSTSEITVTNPGTCSGGTNLGLPCYHPNGQPSSGRKLVVAGSDGCPTGTCAVGSSNPGAACELDSECPIAGTCNAASTNAGTACTSDTQCPIPGTCAGGASQGLPCSYNSNCPILGTCTSGSNASGSCSSSSECPVMQCAGGTNQGQMCSSNQDCPEPAGCVGGTNDGSACNSDADCPTKTCSKGSNSGLSCNSDADCPWGNSRFASCVDGFTTCNSGYSTCGVSGYSTCEGAGYSTCEGKTYACDNLGVSTCENVGFASCVGITYATTTEEITQTWNPQGTCVKEDTCCTNWCSQESLLGYGIGNDKLDGSGFVRTPHCLGGSYRGTCAATVLIQTHYTGGTGSVCDDPHNMYAPCESDNNGRVTAFHETQNPPVGTWNQCALGEFTVTGHVDGAGICHCYGRVADGDGGPDTYDGGSLAQPFWKELWNSGCSDNSLYLSDYDCGGSTCQQYAEMCGL